jgi:DNA-binding IclR family transcriptional regulator
MERAAACVATAQPPYGTSAPAVLERSAARRSDALGPRPLVAPFARALSLLAVFTPHDRWLASRELAARSKLPPTTVTRIAQSLVQLGYLRHDAARHQYRLAAAVLALGYAAIAHSDVQRTARVHMQAFAEQHRVHVHLGARDRLDVMLLGSCSSSKAPLSLNLHAGVRVGLAASPLGWALLAALPQPERQYLLEHLERRMPREWPRLRRRTCEAIVQVNQLGFCTSLGEWDHDLGIVAAPLAMPGQSPLVVSCIGSSAQTTRARVERELGPRLLALAAGIQAAVTA